MQTSLVCLRPVSRCIVCIVFSAFFGCGRQPAGGNAVENSQTSTSVGGQTNTAEHELVVDSPEAVFTAARRAAKEGDYVRVIQCHSIETQDGLANYTVMAAAMLRFASDKFSERGDNRLTASKQRIDQILVRHQIDPGEVSKVDIRDSAQNRAFVRGLLGRVDDQTLLVAELLAELEAAKGGPTKTTGFQDELDGELVDLKINRDRAEATVLPNGQAQAKKPIFFKKTRSGWRIHMPIE